MRQNNFALMRYFVMLLQENDLLIVASVLFMLASIGLYLLIIRDDGK